MEKAGGVHGHKILRTTPYHPELQPIETCWGVVKSHIAKNCDFTMKNLIKQLDGGFEKVTKETCKACPKDKEIEDDFWVSGVLAKCKEFRHRWLTSDTDGSHGCLQSTLLSFDQPQACRKKVKT